MIKRYKTKKSYLDIIISEEEQELVEMLAVKHDIKNKKGEYSSDIAWNAILFNLDVILQFINHKGNYQKLCTAFGNITPRLRRLHNKVIENKYDLPFKYIEEYVDWHNNYIDVIHNRSNYQYTDAYKHLECPNKEDFINTSTKKDNSIYKSYRNYRMEKREIILLKYLYKAVKVINGEYKDIIGIVRNVSYDCKLIISISDNKTLYIKPENTIFISNLTTQI